MPYLQNMKPLELKEAVDKNIPLMVSVGSIEYHGSQLPLGTDLLIIEGLLRELEKKTEIVVAPPFTFSPTGYMVSGEDRGTVDIHIGTFIEYCSQILSAYKGMGFKRIYVLVHHQGGSIKRFLQLAVEQINSYSAYEQTGKAWWTDGKKPQNTCEIKVEAAQFGEEVTKEFFGHGGEGETQPIMAYYPELVRMDYLTDDEASWNKSVVNANMDDAVRARDLLIDQWIKKLEEEK
ncbi:MAG: creatininase family protein [Clostridia bacterium]|nr:creatininase family protein [Clostridia bacterium]